MFAVAVVGLFALKKLFEIGSTSVIPGDTLPVSTIGIAEPGEPFASVDVTIIGTGGVPVCSAED